MPDLRTLLMALGVGAGIAAYTTLWWQWPLAFGGGVGIIIGGLTLVGSVSLGPDPEEADAAWRAAAPEFSDPPSVPGLPTSSSVDPGGPELTPAPVSDGAPAAPHPPAFRGDPTEPS